MKKNLLFVAMVTMTLASCVQEEGLVNELSSLPKEITYQTVVAKQKTRALIDGTEYGKSAPIFGSWARYNPNGLTVGTMAYIENDKIEYLAEEGNSIGYWGIAEDEHKHEWPGSGSLTFFSYSPYYFQENPTDVSPDNMVADQNSAPRFQYGISFTDYNVHSHQQTDLMVADVQVGQTANITSNEGVNQSDYTGVPTIFRHKLAVILAFKLSTSEDYDGLFVPGGESGPWNTNAKVGDKRFYIKYIKLKNLNVKGTYHGETYTTDTEGNNVRILDKWVAPTTQETKNYVWYDNNEGVEFGYASDKNVTISWTKTENEIHKNPTISSYTETVSGGTTTITDEDEWNTNNRDLFHLLVLPQDFEKDKQQLEVEYFYKTYAPETQEEQNPTDLTQAEAAWKGGPGNTIKRTVDLQLIHPDGYKGWKMNQKIIYNLKFSTTEIRWAPQVVEWENAYSTGNGYTLDL